MCCCGRGWCQPEAGLVRGQTTGGGETARYRARVVSNAIGYAVSLGRLGFDSHSWLDKCLQNGEDHRSSRRSSVRPQCLEWIDPRRAERRNRTGHKADDEEDPGDDGEAGAVGRGDAE
jgi:hypothetical protein